MAKYHSVQIFHFPKLHDCAKFCALDLSNVLFSGSNSVFEDRSQQI